MSISGRLSRSLAHLPLVALLAAAGCIAESPGPDIGAPELQDRVPRDGDEALQWLLEGNARFVAGQSWHDHQSLARRATLSDQQHPFAIVLGCADSRVPPEIVFDVGLGDLFVIRVAGNVVADDEAGSIEYAIDHLGVLLVVVLGHEGCGGVTAALDIPEGEIEELIRLLQKIEPALVDIDPSLPKAERVRLGVEANVRQSMRQLLDIIEREGGPRPGRRLVGAVYDVATGRVRILSD